MIGRQEIVLGNAFGFAVEVDGVDSLVGAKQYAATHPCPNCRLDNISAPIYIGLPELEGVYLSLLDSLERCGVDNHFAALKSHLETVSVTDITEVAAKARIMAKPSL
jgi:hypothetical protein